MYNPVFDNSIYNRPDQNQYRNQYQTPNSPYMYNESVNQYEDPRSAYVYGESMSNPQPMNGDMTESQLYPYENNYASSPYATGTPQANFGYAQGGMVQKSHNNLPSLAEMIRQQGNNEDSILAHINPIEAMILKQIGGSGTINPKTGLPQFSFWNKPGKATRTSAGSIIGTIIGNMILPGVGGVIGGAIGQGTQNAARGKSFGQGALKGASIGAMIPGAASAAGMGANALGFTGAGSALSSYGATNSVLASLGMNGLGSGAGVAAGNVPMKEYALSNLSNNVVVPNAGGAAQGAASAADPGFLSKLGTNSSNFFSKPKNLMAVISAAGSLAGRKKEKTPEQLAREKKRYEQALMLTAQERAAMEANETANRQMQRRIERNSILPEQRFAVNPIYRRVASPEEYRRTNSWLSYHDNPEMALKKGGKVKRPVVEIEEFEVDYPVRERFLDGYTDGQNDEVKALLSDGEYVIPADVVSHLGDGNNRAGSHKLDNLLELVRKDKKAPKGLPPKVKSLSSYIRR